MATPAATPAGDAKSVSEVLLENIDANIAALSPRTDDNENAVVFKFVAVNATADGDNTVLSAVSGKKFRVVGFMLTFVGTTGEGRLKSSGGLAIAVYQAIEGSPVTYSGGIDCPAGDGTAGEALVISNPTGMDTKGFIVYYEITA